MKNCTSHSTGYTDVGTSTTTAGSEHRVSASFSGGLRLEGLPVPYAPVGSLLAVACAGQELHKPPLRRLL